MLELAVEERGASYVDLMTSVRMDKDQTNMTERILDLTLEIIYLLTGEDYKVVKKISGEPLTPSKCLHGTSPITEPPPLRLTTEINRDKKILEVTKKMIDLLTGEVPIRCQDVTVSVEEYLDGHRDLYKDIVMENEPHLTSPDGSSKRNPPERCPRPLFSRDSTHEELTIPHHDQGEELKVIKVVVIEEEEEETLVSGAQQSMEQGEMMMTEKEEESSLDITKDGSSKRNPPERCPRPLYSRDSTKEDLTTPHHDQGEELKDIKVVVIEEEETLVNGAPQSMEDGEMMMMKSNQEESSLQIDTNGRHVWNITKRHLILSRDCYEGDDDITQHSPGVNPITHNRHHRPSHSETSMDPSNPEESSDESQTVTADIHLRSQSAERSTDPSNSTACLGYGGHTGESSFSSLVCGNLALLRIEKSNTAESLYFSPGNGKCFIQNGDLLNHQRIQEIARPFSCSECGKSFSRKGKLTVHQKIHTDERPYVCSECGKSYIEKRYLMSHQRVHTGERPFSCSECGKCFTKKLGLTRHLKIHTGERPFSCSECGRSFTQQSVLFRHKSIHTGEKSFSCSECGKCFSRKGSVVIHMKTHTRDRHFS